MVHDEHTSSHVHLVAQSAPLGSHHVSQPLGMLAVSMQEVQPEHWLLSQLHSAMHTRTRRARGERWMCRGLVL